MEGFFVWVTLRFDEQEEKPITMTKTAEYINILKYLFAILLKCFTRWHSIFKYKILSLVFNTKTFPKTNKK